MFCFDKSLINRGYKLENKVNLLSPKDHRVAILERRDQQVLAARNIFTILLETNRCEEICLRKIRFARMLGASFRLGLTMSFWYQETGLLLILKLFFFKLVVKGESILVAGLVVDP